MIQPTLEELEKAAEEVLSKAAKSEDLDPDDISENSEDTEADEEKDAEESSESAAEGESDDDDDTDDEETEKSILTELLEHNVPPEAVSAACIDVVAKSLTNVIGSLDESREFSQKSTGAFVKSLMAQSVVLDEQQKNLARTNRQIVKMQKSLAEKLEAIETKLDAIADQPAHVRKSVASYSVTDRNFKGSLEGTEGAPEPLSKAQVMSILNNELMSGSQIVQPQDIVNAECGAQMRDEVRALIESKRAR